MEDVTAPCTQTLLTALGLASRDGRASVDAQRKVAQVRGLLPWLLRPLGTARGAPARVIEFGCGKAYLGFFLALARRKAGQVPVPILGVDRRADLVARCRHVRDLLDWPELEFVEARCEEFRTLRPPTLVCALHACDVATDHAIAAAIDLGAEHIIVAPCCHSTVQRRLREAGHPHAWGRIARCYPLLGSRFSEFVTEAMRCLALRAHGYDVQVREFVSGAATPKNVVVVASRLGRPSVRAREELHGIETALGLASEVERSLARRRGEGGTGKR